MTYSPPVFLTASRAMWQLLKGVKEMWSGFPLSFMTFFVWVVGHVSFDRPTSYEKIMNLWVERVREGVGVAQKAAISFLISSYTPYAKNNKNRTINESNQWAPTHRRDRASRYRSSSPLMTTMASSSAPLLAKQEENMPSTANQKHKKKFNDQKNTKQKAKQA